MWGGDGDGGGGGIIWTIIIVNQQWSRNRYWFDDVMISRQMGRIFVGKEIDQKGNNNRGGAEWKVGFC